MTKRLFILLSLIFGTICLGFSQNGISYLFNQDMVDSCHKYIKTATVEVSNSDTALNFRHITDISPILKYIGYYSLTIQNTDIESFNVLKYNGSGEIILRNNDKLRSINNLSLLKGFELTIDNCNALQIIDFNLDTNDRSSHLFKIINNTNLKSIKISLDNPNYKAINNFEIGNNPLLKKIELYNSKFTTETIEIYNNSILDSLIINRFNNIEGYYHKPWNQYKLNAQRYLEFSGVLLFDPSIFGSRLFVYNNNSISYIGGGFEKDSIILTRLYLKNNPQLNNLCVLQDIIKKFPTPDTSNIMRRIYQIENNAPGANSLEEVLTKDCSKQSQLNHANTSDNLIIYPNPVSDAVYFKLPEQIHIDKCIIRNIEGKILHVFTDVDMQHSIQLPEITTGLYFFEIYSNGKKYFAKFMKE